MPRSFPIPPEQRLIRTFTGRAEAPIRTIWLKAAGSARSEISIEGLEAFLSGARTATDRELRAVIKLDTMIGRLELDLTPLLEALLHRSASAGELVFAETMGFPPLDLGIFRRDAAQAARTMVGDLIKGIEAGRLNPLTGIRSKGTLETVRGIIGEGFDLGRPHAQSARLIREVIGLDDRRAGALAKYAAKLEAKGVPEKQRLAKIAAESRRKLQSRGLAVSRTESVRAASIAQDMIWERALSEGQMPDVWEQEWVASPNAFNPEKCPSGVCKGLHHKRAPIGGEFRPGVKGPPIHPHCGCARRLRRKE